MNHFDGFGDKNAAAGAEDASRSLKGKAIGRTGAYPIFWQATGSTRSDHIRQYQAYLLHERKLAVGNRRGANSRFAVLFRAYAEAPFCARFHPVPQISETSSCDTSGSGANLAGLPIGGTFM
jgi:hypothetical protein